MIYILFAIMYRCFLLKNKERIWELYQMYAPRCMPKCTFCLGYNLSSVEWVLWTIGITELINNYPYYI